MRFPVGGEPGDIQPPWRLQANNGDALAELAARGLGIAILPDFIAADHLRCAAQRIECVRLMRGERPPQARRACAQRLRFTAGRRPRSRSRRCGHLPQGRAA